MKKKVLLISLALCLLMLFAVAAPVMAYDPKPDPSLVVGIVSAPNLSIPPTVIPTLNGEIVLGLHITDYAYSTILGSATGNEEDWYQLNVGTSIGSGVDTIVTAISSEHDVYTFNGLGYWTYTGPTFTYKGPSCGAAVNGAVITTGKVLHGLLVTGIGTIHFTSGPLAGVTTVDTWAGVGFLDNSGIYAATYYGA